MSFEGIDKILNALTQQPGWEEYHHYRQILLAWERSISPRLRDKTRVVSLSRGVVFIATSSAALAQDLTLQRSNLIKLLNATLDQPVTDIRFSSAAWQEKSNSKHSSTLDSRLPTPDSPSSESGFSHSFGQRSLTWTTCPICAAPTPEKELRRWNCCAFCWSRSPEP